MKMSKVKVLTPTINVKTLTLGEEEEDLETIIHRLNVLGYKLADIIMHDDNNFEEVYHNKELNCTIKLIFKNQPYIELVEV
jgi:hypothetical protein